MKYDGEMRTDIGRVGQCDRVGLSVYISIKEREKEQDMCVWVLMYDDRKFFSCRVTTVLCVCVYEWKMYIYDLGGKKQSACMCP